MEWEILEEDHAPLSDELIDGFSKVTGFFLPKDYVACVKAFHGGQPKGRSLTISANGEAWEIGFGELLTLDPLTYGSNVIKELCRLRQFHQLPPQLLPIVMGGGGDFLCLDYSISGQEPRVVFYFHELEVPEAIFPVASSFSDLISMLRPVEA